MGKPKDVKKKKPEAADLQTSGSREKNNPASTVVDLVQMETGAFEPVQREETGSENLPMVTQDVGEQNLGPDDSKETVTDEGASHSDGEGPQQSVSEGRGDSPDTGGSVNVDPFGRSVGTGSENLPMIATDAKAQSADPGKTQGAGADGDSAHSEGKGSQASVSEAESGPDNSPDSAVGTEVSQANETESGQPNVMADSLEGKELPKAKIDELARKIKVNCDQVDNFALKNGMLLLTEVFGGKLDEALSRNPKKQKSFADICRHPDVNVDATTLSRWVQAANMVKTFEGKGTKFRSLTCSHYIALLPLEKEDNRLCLAKEADEKKLSVRELAQEVKKLEPPSPKSLLERISSKLGNPKELAKEENSLSDKKKWAEELKAEDRATLITEVGNAKVKAQTYVNALARFHSLLKAIAVEAKSEGN